ncbi:MAG: ABC-2 transporter permease [Lachnospiraceae bacterium]|nr:ABC-2 transporter permease [Lachnospiraceae bacterium]
MKGLLIKDICLLMRQKKMLLLYAVLLLVFCQYGKEVSIGYFIMSCFFLGENTICNDMDNHNLGYLMTLPVSRRTYVIEKYAFCLVPGIVVTALTVVICLVVAGIQGQMTDASVVVVSCVGFFLACSLLDAVFLPIELLGMENAKKVLNIACAAFGAGLGMLAINGEAMDKARAYAMSVVESVNKVGLGAGTLGIWLVVMVSSIVCSVVIMEKKQF